MENKQNRALMPILIGIFVLLAIAVIGVLVFLFMSVSGNNDGEVDASQADAPAEVATSPPVENEIGAEIETEDEEDEVEVSSEVPVIEFDFYQAQANMAARFIAENIRVLEDTVATFRRNLYDDFVNEAVNFDDWTWRVLEAFYVLDEYMMPMIDAMNDTLRDEAVRNLLDERYFQAHTGYTMAVEGMHNALDFMLDSIFAGDADTLFYDFNNFLDFLGGAELFIDIMDVLFAQ